jgi:2-methylcitrate dehydratase PrpD
VAAKAKANLVYELACAIASGERARPAWALARGSGPADATLLVDGGRVHVEQAAFANSVALHARAQDDTHYASQAHPGAAILPAALALAEQRGTDGATLLTAIVAGYEVTAGVGERLVDPVVARGFRAAAVFGALGAAAASAAVLGLDAERTGHAIALGAGFAAGLTQTWIDGADDWAYQLGTTARGGVTAALLAEQGVRGAERALEGAYGFASAFAGTPLDAPEWPLEAGDSWRVRDVIYKPYPACNIAQAPVAVAAELAARHTLGPGDVVRVRCALNPEDRDYPGTLGRGPFHGTGGPLMSVVFCVAAALRHGGLSLEGLARHDDPDTSALTARVEVVPDPALPRLAAWLEIETTDGRMLRGELRPDHATYAWDVETVETWARAVCHEAGEPGARAGERMIAAVRDLESSGAAALARATVLSS